VSLLSLHAAKGLEFDTVFLTGMEEGLLPHFRSLDSAGAVEEERRLCYVGITRARVRLYLTYAQMRTIAGNAATGGPSRFLADIGTANMTLKTSSTAIHRPRLSGAEVGDRVVHTRWGMGTVSDISGIGTAALATIEFEQVGTKRVQLCHAPLRRVVENDELALG
jgi:DNA helicase-2/ATP-dependent DNA helicase PcrA